MRMTALCYFIKTVEFIVIIYDNFVNNYYHANIHGDDSNVMIFIILYFNFFYSKRQCF